MSGPIMQGPIIQGPIIQGWCPGALRPMRSGDGWVVRVRPPGGRLTQAQAAGIAALAVAHGNGLIDLSARANVQLRGVTPETHTPLIEGLEALGLLDSDPEREARRNIVVAPFWGEDDPAPRIAAALAQALAAADAPATPGKFGYAVDTGTTPVLREVSADIRIERGEGGLICRADGADRGALVSEDNAADVALALARWFLEAGGAPEGRGRMAALLARVTLPERFAGASARGVAEAGAGAADPDVDALSAGQQSQSQPAAASASWDVAAQADAASTAFDISGRAHDASPVVRRQSRSKPLPHTPPPRPGPHPAGALVAFEFGQLHAETLATLAQLGRLRVTPWRMLLIEGAATPPAIPGLITRPDDPLLNVTACTGAPGCLQAHAPTRPLARALAAHIKRPLHVSGCAKGCAHPGPSALTLTATARGFDLIRDGSAADAPALTGLDPQALIRDPSILNGPTDAPV